MKHKDPKDGSSKRTTENGSRSSEETTNPEVFIASGPYFTSFQDSNSRQTTSNLDKPSTSKCNVVLTNVEPRKICRLGKKLLHLGNANPDLKPTRQLSSSISDISTTEPGSSQSTQPGSSNKQKHHLKKLLSSSQELFHGLRNVQSNKNVADNNAQASTSSGLQVPNSSNDQNGSRDSFENEPIHMTLEEVKALMASSSKGQTSPNEKACGSASKEKKSNKIKVAFQQLLHKTQSCIPVTNDDYGVSTVQTPERSQLNTSSSEACSSLHHGNCQELSANLSNVSNVSTSPFEHRALPPVPETAQSLTRKRPVVHQMKRLDSILSYKMKNMTREERSKYLEYMESISRVKQCGWYWGPVSGEMAEKLLQNEPCGSFIVRDSSDEHYIFSLTFKLNGMIRHVRIEHDHGNFSFGPGRKYKNNTIVEFIEGAVEHSRNGQFLFFLHRVPIDGPDGVLRIQLLNPVSRFRKMQSLQHLCRFAILKLIRRDQIHLLDDVPDMIKVYLDTPYHFSEELESLHGDGPPPESDEVRLILHRKIQSWKKWSEFYRTHHQVISN